MNNEEYNNYLMKMLFFNDSNSNFKGLKQEDLPNNLQPNQPKHKKTMLQQLTNTLKKILPSDIQKQYRAGFRNGDLAITELGLRELTEILADKFKKELTDRALEVIKSEEKK